MNGDVVPDDGAVDAARARTLVWDSLARIAPEVDPASVDPQADLRDEFDLDSMDFLNFLEELHRATGLDVPERDYPQLASLSGCIEYVTHHGPG